MDIEAQILQVFALPPSVVDSRLPETRTEKMIHLGYFDRFDGSVDVDAALRALDSELARIEKLQ